MKPSNVLQLPANHVLPKPQTHDMSHHNNVLQGAMNQVSFFLSSSLFSSTWNIFSKDDFFRIFIFSEKFVTPLNFLNYFSDPLETSHSHSHSVRF